MQIETVYPTKGTAFGMEKSKQLASLIYQRFGCDLASAANAWRRMLQNNCSNRDFEKLIELSPEYIEVRDEDLDAAYHNKVVALIKSFDPEANVTDEFIGLERRNGQSAIQACESWFDEHKYDLSRLVGVKGKCSKFSQEVRKLQRPYIPIGNGAYEMLESGKYNYYQVPTGQIVTFGYADGGFALMPLQEEYAKKLIK
jgi:hypothetical protein